jgi:hypothetical protein
MKLNRDVFFDSVRSAPFTGSMSQDQVDGMNAILDTWENAWTENDDLRKLGYMLATTFHETAQKMQPVPENGKGEGKDYGKKDPETGQVYYGRGFVQLTWRDNYARADEEMGWTQDQSCEWNADLQLDAYYASPTMFKGMFEGWFRASSDGKRQTLGRWFNDTTDDPYNARECINGDKAMKPSWGGGKTYGQIIADYYMDFTAALNRAAEAAPPDPRPEPDADVANVTIHITADRPVNVSVTFESPVVST